MHCSVVIGQRRSVLASSFRYRLMRLVERHWANENQLKKKYFSKQGSAKSLNLSKAQIEAIFTLWVSPHS